MTTRSIAVSYISFALLAIGNLLIIATLLFGLSNTDARVFYIIGIDILYALLTIRYDLLPRIPVGTKSLLYGAHQFLWHPLTVWLAWHDLYGWPNWKECVCIFIHDWGYWGCPNMEGPEGEKHPEFAARIADKYLDGNEGTIDGKYDDPFNPNPVAPKDTYRHLCLFHSRTYAKHWCTFPSKLCWADKLSAKYERWWTYLPRVYLSGEIHEYRSEAEKAGLINPKMSDRDWFEWAKARMIRKADEKDERPPYQEGS